MKSPVLNRMVFTHCRRLLLIPCILFPVASPLCATERVELPHIPPTEPIAAPATFTGVDGFTMQLLAAEPLTTDPVAGAYDEFGRLWVVEMNDYPYTDKSSDVPNVERTADLPLGKVRILSDDNDDGLFDRSEIFARELSWPTGIALYRGGAFVLGTPDVWYLKDTDGDGVADLREKIFTGFRKLNVQAVVNNLIWGIDGKIYGAGGTNGGTVRFQGSDTPIPFSRGDFRFDPRAPRFELISGGARFGNCFDDWGNRFICNIRNPAQQILFPAEYLSRNPYLPVTSSVHDVTLFGDQVPVFRASPPEPWRLVNAQRLMNQGDPLIPRSEKNAVGFMTSACGTTVYRGDAFPPEYHGQLFIGEVAGNLIHRESMTLNGVTFSAKRIDDRTEFLTSTDNWFRPVNFIHAPDGTLHVLDMYRETIEHPWSIPDELKPLVDLESGRDRGRIYRLTPPNFRRRSGPYPASMTNSELVKTLSHPNSWHRETAQRLLFERNDHSVFSDLREVIRTGESALGRMHALWTLEVLDASREDDLIVALEDPEPGVREQGIRIAEKFLQDPGNIQLRNRVIELAEDPAPRVRFQTAFTLGTFSDERCAEALEKIARRDAHDPAITTALLSSAVDLAPLLLREFSEDPEFLTERDHLPLLEQLSVVVGAGNRVGEILPLLDLVRNATERNQGLKAAETIVAGLHDGLRKNGKSLRDICKDPSNSSDSGKFLLATLLVSNRSILADESLTSDIRIAGLRIIATAEYPKVAEDLFRILTPRNPQDLQLATVRLIAGYSDPEIAGRLLAGWRGYSPQVQFAVAEACVNQSARLPALFDSIESGIVPATQLSPLRRTLLMKHPDAKIRDRALKLFAGTHSGSRKELLDRYSAGLTETGDAMRGKTLFEKQCQICHRIGSTGYDVGPSLVTVKHRTPIEILTAILDPNRELGPNYVQYAILLDDGRTLTGMISEENATSVTLKQQENRTEVILRANIEEISNSGISLMPEGLEKNISTQEMSDLIAFLRSI